MRYKLVIFDFDGTIADTSDGIIDSYQYALGKMGREVPSIEELYNLIGGNLLDIYIKYFGFSEMDARKVIKIYRERYAQVGVHKAKLYSGFKQLLVSLKMEGVKIGIATLKAEKFARLMIEELEISGLFDCVCGMDSQDGLSKAELVKKCAYKLGIAANKTVLIGDTEGDYKGACEANVGFIGVSYGFGFVPEKKYKFTCCNTCNEILELLTKE